MYQDIRVCLVRSVLQPQVLGVEEVSYTSFAGSYSKSRSGLASLKS